MRFYKYNLFGPNIPKEYRKLEGHEIILSSDAVFDPRNKNTISGVINYEIGKSLNFLGNGYLLEGCFFVRKIS
jgi:hypothetical protein